MQRGNALLRRKRLQYSAAARHDLCHITRLAAQAQRQGLGILLTQLEVKHPGPLLQHRHQSQRQQGHRLVAAALHHQWVLSVPKRLRYFMQRDGATLNMVLRIFLRVLAQSLQAHSPGAAQLDKNTLHIAAIAFIHRFGSSLNGHVHFHVCVVDGGV